MPAPAIRQDRVYAHARYASFYDLELDSFRADLPFYLRHLPPPPCRILELGCGTGRVSRALSREGYQVTGIDLSPAMLAEALSKNYPAETGASVHYACMDMTRLGFSAPFDAIIAPYNTFNLLGKSDALRTCLSQLDGILAAKGKLLLQLYIPDEELRTMDGRSRFQFQILDLPEGAKLIKEIRKCYLREHSLVEMKECYLLRFRKNLPNEDWQYSYRILGHSAEEWLGFLAEYSLTPDALYGTYDLEPFREKEHSLLLLAARRQA